MVVLATFSAVPVVVLMVLTMVVLFCVADTVPPPVAVKPGLVRRAERQAPGEVDGRPGVRVQEMPWPVSVMGR